MVSPRASMATYGSMRRAQVSARLAASISGGMMDLMFGRHSSQPSEADVAAFREAGHRHQDAAPTWAWRLLSVAPLGGAAAAAVFVTGGFPLWVPILLAVPGVTALLAP